MRRRDVRGFTLIEVLVTFVLLAMIVVMVTGGLRVGLKAWEAGDQRSDDLMTIQATQSILDTMVSQTTPVRKENTDLPDFSGAKDQLDFIAPLPAHLGMAGLFRIRLKASSNDGDWDLVLSWLPYHPEFSADDFAREIPKLFVGGAKAITFQYFGMGRFRGGSALERCLAGHAGCYPNWCE